MSNEHGEWIIHGRDWNDPECLHSKDDLVKYINKVGFLPLFKNEIEGFSVEEYTDPAKWWAFDSSTDPWVWRELIASEHEIAYGKFFGKKAGFISKKWFPIFANVRRDGYDFDALWDDQKAKRREKLIMDCVDMHEELLSANLKEMAGFGKGKEKNFEGIITELQMKTYLTAYDYGHKVNKKGEEYGWSIAIYATPEHMWGRDFVTSCYKDDVDKCRDKIIKQMKKLYDVPSDEKLRKLLNI